MARPTHCDQKSFSSVVHNQHGEQVEEELTVPCEHPQTMVHTIIKLLSESVTEEKGEDEEAEIVTLTMRDSGQPTVGITYGSSRQKKMEV